MFAVIEIKKQQYKVSPDETFLVDLLKDVKKGDKIEADRVLLIAEEDGSDVKIGTPNLNSSVELEVLGDELGDKIRVYKMKPKKRYRKTQGSRAKLTKLKVIKIGRVSAKESIKTEETIAEPKPEVKTEAKEEVKEQA
ncbi:50S ribosomal protein L21 [Patescibacteria group bacterium]|nr:50S ribosomal protein L21 [Patescibacteria group bacterium]